MEKYVWKLSEEEVSEIRKLFEKKVALENLVKIIDPENQKLYAKVTEDYTTLLSQYQGWWGTMSQKYNWERSEKGGWTVNFETCEVFLME